MKTLAIMQPTFVPWIGYFALAEFVDEFILLDDVQFDKRSWQQRNRIKTGHGIKWLTVPVLSSGKRTQRINEVQVNQTAKFPRKQMHMLQMEYKKASFFSDVMPLLTESSLGRDSVEFLCEMNIELIERIAGYLELDASFALASNFDVEGEKDVRLFNLCRAAGATHYVSPPGSSDYLNQSKAFASSDIAISYFRYVHPTYTQLHGDFESHLSVIDLLMNEGKLSANVIRDGMSDSAFD